MKKSVTKLVVLSSLLISLTAFGDKLDVFQDDFQRALQKDFSQKELNLMFRKHSEILTPHSNVSRLKKNSKVQSIKKYPLSKFKERNLYERNIKKLLFSKNPNHRLLSYLIIASSGDKSFESILLERIETEVEKANLLWAGMALLHLETNKTTVLFDFLVKNENYRDAHMIPMYVNLDNELLKITAYNRIKSENKRARILAAQILSKTELNSKTERLLKEAVREWDIDTKGYAIYSIKELRIGDLLSTLKPYLTSTKIRDISLNALANSPTISDQQYIYSLIKKQDVVGKELLNSLLLSKNIDNIKSWLKILYTKKLPEKYVFFVLKQPLLSSDMVLHDLHKALDKINKPEILQELVRALKGRTDEVSLDLILSFLKHENSSVRYWAAFTLKGSTSSKLHDQLPSLLKASSIRTVALTDLIIENNINSLQSVYEGILDGNPGRDWKRSAIKYLSVFPLRKHKKIFRRILQDKNEDTFVQRSAVLGLGRLKDTESVGLIVDACRRESKSSDYNAQTYLIALGMIKGKEARREIEKYKKSKERIISDLSIKILEEWDKK